MNVSNRSFFRSLLVTGVAAACGLAAAQMVPKSATPSSSSPVADQSEKGKAEAAAKRNDRARGFIENKGQWPDEALFLGRSNGLNMWVTRDGLRLDAFTNSSNGSQGNVVDIRFEGGSKLTGTGLQPTPMMTDFIGYKHDAKGAKTYAEVVSKNVYRGISLKSYFDGSRPRYDFIVSPSAKPEQIRMKLLGAQGFTASGSKLAIKTTVGDIVQQGLAAYQVVDGKEKSVRVAFKSLGKDTFGFKLGQYDATKPLVIDPLIYGSYYGGDSGMDEVHAVVSDLLGGVYMAGSTRSPDFPVIYGPYYFSLNKGWAASDGRDAFVSKLEGDAYRHDYAVYIGGRKDDTADFLQLDQFGNLWVAGYTESNEFPGNVNTNPNVQYIYYDTLHSKGPGPNGAGRFRVSLPTLGGVSDYILWNSPASIIQSKIQAYLDVVAPGQTVTVEPTAPNGTVMDNLGMKVTFSAGIKGEMTVDNHLLGAYYTSKVYGVTTGRGQVLSAPAGTPAPTNGQFTLSYSYASNGVNYTATTAPLAYNATPAAVQIALRAMTSPLDPDQTKPLAGATVVPGVQQSTAVLPAVPYVILLPVRVGNWGTIVYNNVSMDRPYIITKTGVTDIYWDTTSSTPTGPDGAGPPGADYNANGAAFNLGSGGSWTQSPVPYDVDADLLHDRIQTIPSIGTNMVVIPSTPTNQMPTDVMSVVAVNNLLGFTITFGIANDQVIQGGALGTTPPVVLSEGRVSPTAIYAVRSESRVFLMRFAQDPNTSLNPLPSKIFYFGSGVAPKLTGFRIIPHDNPVAGEAVRFAFSGNVSRVEQFLPEIAGTPRAVQAGFMLRVNYTDAAGFSVVSGSSKYVDAAGTIDGQDYSIPVLVNGIDVDSNANIYIAGTIVGPFGNPIDTSLTDDFGNYVFQTTGVDTTSYLREGRLLRYADGFVRKYSSGGNLTYSVLIGGDGADEGFGVAVDANSNAYMLGRSRSFNYPRTRGVYGETFTQATVSTVAKLNSSATDLVYCTHLRTGGTVTGIGIAVDSRGVAYSTFEVSRGTIFRAWTQDNDPNLCDGFEVVGSIPTTGDAVKSGYTQPGGGDYGSVDGGLIALNPSATNILYGTYLGGNLDDSVYRPYVDKGGDVWVCGYTDTFRAYVRAAAWHPIIRRFQVKTALPNTMITPLAFRVLPDPNNGFGSAASTLMPGTEYNNEHDFFPVYWDVYKDRDGYVQRFRIGLTSVTQVAFNPTTIAGGLGASTTGVVTLSQPAPAGGANVVLTMSSSAPASFASGSDLSTTSITIPAGSTQGTFTLYSKEVPDNTPVDVTATYQGNFKVGRVVITPWLQSFSITPQEVVGGNKVAGRIQLAFPAGTGGMNVTVNSDKPGIVPVSNVVVPAGQNAVVFDINSNGVDTDTTVTVTASLLGIGKAFQLVVHPAQLKSLTFNPASVTSGSPSTGTLVLNGMAGPTGFNVNLAVEGAPGGYTLSPGTLNFANGQTTKTFTITTPYESATIARVVDATMQPAAGYTPNTVKGTLTVNAVSITDLTITPNTVAGGATASGQITLSAPALAGGAKVDISVSPNDGVVTVPTQVLVPAGQTTFTFNIPTTTTLGTTAYTVTASRGSSSDSATLTVNGLTFGLNIPTVIPGGSSTTGTVTLSGPAPIGGIAVNLTSSNPTLLSVAGTVTIAGGQTSVTFPITAQNVTSDTSVNVSAKIGSTTITKSTLVTASKLIGMTINPNYVMNLTATTITLKLNGPAPSNGLVVNLSNTNPFIVSVPSKVTVPAGKSSYSFTVMTYRVTRTLSATISGISQNNGNASALITVHY